VAVSTIDAVIKTGIKKIDTIFASITRGKAGQAHALHYICIARIVTTVNAVSPVLYTSHVGVLDAVPKVKRGRGRPRKIRPQGMPLLPNRLFSKAVSMGCVTTSRWPGKVCVCVCGVCVCLLLKN
jgi:hypothetical protein